MSGISTGERDASEGKDISPGKKKGRSAQGKGGGAFIKRRKDRQGGGSLASRENNGAHQGASFPSETAEENAIKKSWNREEGLGETWLRSKRKAELIKICR